MDYDKLKRVIHDIAVETGGPEARVRTEPGSAVTLEAKQGMNLSPKKVSIYIAVSPRLVLRKLMQNASSFRS